MSQLVDFREESATRLGSQTTQLLDGHVPVDRRDCHVGIDHELPALST